MKSVLVSMVIDIALKTRCLRRLSGIDTPSTGTGQLYSTGVGETRTGALWLQDAWKIVPNLKLTLGGRLETWRALDGFNINHDDECGRRHITRTVPTNQPGLNSTEFLSQGVAVVRSQQGLEHHREFRRGIPLSDRHRALSECCGRHQYLACQPDVEAGTGFHRRIERRTQMERRTGPAEFVQGANQQRHHLADKSRDQSRVAGD